MKNKIIEIFTSTRFKSFYWRTSMMALAGLISLLAESIGSGMSTESTVLLGLALGELSKAIRNFAKENTYV